MLNSSSYHVEGWYKRFWGECGWSSVNGSRVGMFGPMTAHGGHPCAARTPSPFKPSQLMLNRTETSRAFHDLLPNLQICEQRKCSK